MMMLSPSLLRARFSSLTSRRHFSRARRTMGLYHRLPTGELGKVNGFGSSSRRYSVFARPGLIDGSGLARR